MPRRRGRRQRVALISLSLAAIVFPVALPAVAAPTTISGQIIEPIERSTLVMRDLAARSAPSRLLPPSAKEEEVDEGPLPSNLPVPKGVPIQSPSEGPDAPEGSEPPAEDPPVVAAPPTVGASFRAIDDDISSIPPDTNGAVGPNHVMTTLNNLVRIQTRSGANLTTVTLGAFWSDTGAFDPRVVYDPYHGRFVQVATVDSGATNAGVFVAASATSDPTGTWYRYRYAADALGANWCDFPNLSFSARWLTITCNMFSNGANLFQQAKVFAVDRASVYANAASPGATALTLPSSNGASLAPAITYDAALTTQHLIQSWNGNSGGNGYVRLYTITGPVGGESLTVGSLIGVAAPWHYGGGLGDFAPQQGDARKINMIDDRMLSVYRNGALWATHTVFLPAASPTRAAVQWWKIDPGSATLNQRGRLEDTSTGKSFGFASIAVNSADDMLVGYSSFAASQYASAGYAIRYAADAPNTLQADTLLKAGEAAYYKTYGGGRNRWGDYSATTVDPANDHDFWTVQEYAWTSTSTICDPPETNCDRWSTWWGKIISNSAAAIVSPSPANIAFGEQRQFVASGPQTVTVTNTGAASTTLGTLSLSGANTGDFQLTSTPPNLCNGAPLAPGASCTFGVRFTPATTGARSASVQIPSTAPGSPASVPLSGTGVAPVLVLAPNPLAFGSQQVNTTGSTQHIVVTNNGTASATFSGAVVSGTHATNFAVASDTCTGQTIATGGATCSIGLRFTPSATGARTGVLTVSHNGPSGQSNANLSGTGIAPGVSLNPSSIAFGTVITGESAPPRQVTLTNSGAATLTVATLAVVGTHAAEFALPSDACSGAVLAPAGTCTFSAGFSPGTDGTKSASVQITSDAPGSPTSLPLSGIGASAAPAVGISPSLYSFGNRELTTTSPAASVTITNTGNADLVLGTLGLGGTNPSDFALATDPCSGATLSPATACTVTVTFSPSALGTRTATVGVPSNAAASPHAMTVTGTGIGAGTISFNPSSLGFGSQGVGTTSAPRSITLTNTGAGALTVNAMSIGGSNAANFQLAVDPCSATTLASGQSCQMMITFTPGAVGSHIASLVPSSTASSNPVATLLGTGTQPKLSVSRTTIAFGTNAVGQASPAQSLVVTNTGSGPLGPIVLSMAGAHAGDFGVISNGCTATYAASGSCTVTLRATPTADGARTGTLVLTSNDPLGPTNVTLSAIGDGLPPASTISNADMSVLVSNIQSFSGSVGDVRSGVADLTLTVTNAAGLATVSRPALDCDGARTTCSWRVTAPLIPGIYRVNARGTDLVGNMESPGPTVTLIVL